MGQWRHGHAQFSRQLTEIQQLRAALGDRPGAVFDPRQREQLVSQMGQAISALSRGFQRAAPGLWLGRTQAQLKPRLERRQWRAQFMGGIGNELRLPLELSAQAFGKVIEGTHQWP
ncbi:hypothetical protein D3C86_1742020 [compost metagenome]